MVAEVVVVRAGVEVVLVVEVVVVVVVVVVGSRMVQEIENSNKDNLIHNISKLMKELREAVN